MLSIRIFKEEDRKNVAAILVNNGYRVEQAKVPRKGTKAVDYVLIATDVRDGEKNANTV